MKPVPSKNGNRLLADELTYELRTIPPSAGRQELVPRKSCAMGDWHAASNTPFHVAKCHTLYVDKLILAPMVRVGRLPMRLLALQKGADLVYTEETIDYKLEKCVRTVNETLGTVEYVHNSEVVFQTCGREKNNVILQLGTSNPLRAVKAAQLVSKDVAGIDVNMGCPKHFSVSGGMGSSLLTKPDLVKEILTSLVRNVTLPITCKIRLLPTIAETVTLAQLIEGTGVAAVAVHGRFVTERPREPVHYDYIKAVADSVRIPVIANGASLDIAVYDDIAAVKQKTGCASVMLARAAQWNPSIFSFGKTTANPLDNAREYIKLALQYGQDLGNIKFNLQHLLHFAPDKILKGKLSSAANSQELCELFGLPVHYKEDSRCGLQSLYTTLDSHLFELCRRGYRINILEVPFDRKSLRRANISPKFLLWEYSQKQSLAWPEKPKYCTLYDNLLRKFFTLLSFKGEFYTSGGYYSNKKTSEQAAALASLKLLNVDLPYELYNVNSSL
ncbi:tRNA-dihydrouridine(20) synthase [NAD(P)+]-like [Zophobas morio]|uniref:tRNA-dihydrouridine(20) synthase [NAD(P)+]-like n=1 Tax=Zophobas morio TaxID=2755281 RepID=UPI003082A95F